MPTHYQPVGGVEAKELDVIMFSSPGRIFEVSLFNRHAVGVVISPRKTTHFNRPVSWIPGGGYVSQKGSEMLGKGKLKYYMRVPYTNLMTGYSNRQAFGPGSSGYSPLELVN